MQVQLDIQKNSACKKCFHTFNYFRLGIIFLLITASITTTLGGLITGCLDGPSCGSSNVDLTDAYLGDSNGIPLTEGCIDCTTYTGDIYLYVTIKNQAADRWQSFLLYRIGDSTVKNQQCLDYGFPKGSPGSFSYYNGQLPKNTEITFQLGKFSCKPFKLNDIIITWLQPAYAGSTCTSPDPSCTGRNNAQCEYIASKEVSSVPNCEFTTNSPVCIGQLVNFYGPALMDYYYWDFEGDGTPDTLPVGMDAQNPTHLYLTEGYHTAKLTTMKGLCTTPTPCSQTILIVPYPVATVSGDGVVSS